jgi:hypothetical protein
LTKSSLVPSTSGGALWPDTVNKRLFLFGGEYQNSPQGFSMWSYDVIYDNWTAITPDTTQTGIQGASFGASYAAQDKGVGYYYGGWVSNTTNPNWGSAAPFALSTLLTYDFVHNTWTNNTGPDNIGRAEGAMTYIPASDGGMLVYFGGIQSSVPGNWTGQGLDVSKATLCCKVALIRLIRQTIFLYDISNDKWYKQTATGDIPGMRRRFCGGASWSADYSSYK